MSELTPERIERAILETLDVNTLQNRIRELEEANRKAVMALTEEESRRWKLEAEVERADYATRRAVEARDTANRLLRELVEEVKEMRGCCERSMAYAKALAAAEKHVAREGGEA